MNQIIKSIYKHGFGVICLSWPFQHIKIISINLFFEYILMMYAQSVIVLIKRRIKTFKYLMLSKIKWCSKRKNRIY